LNIVQISGGLDVPVVVSVYRIAHFAASNERTIEACAGKSTGVMKNL
jgi:hypothetical protein